MAQGINTVTIKANERSEFERAERLRIMQEGYELKYNGTSVLKVWIYNDNGLAFIDGYIQQGYSASPKQHLWLCSYNMGCDEIILTK